MEKRRKSPEKRQSKKKRFPLSDNIEMQPRSSDDNFSKSDEKSSVPSTLRHVSETSSEQASSSQIHYDSKRSDITEEQPESENVCESEKKSLSSSISEHDDMETSSEQASSQADDDSEPLQFDITERQPESSKIKNVCESEKKSLSSSIQSQDLERPVEQDSSNREESINGLLPAIMEEQSESSNIKSLCESDEKSLSSPIPSQDLETPVEQDSSNREESISKPLQSDITERQPESLKIKNVCESEKKSLSFSIPSQDLETPVEQDSSNREESNSEPLQYDITERQPESSKIKNVCESEKKSLSSSIPSQDLETPAEQDSSNREESISKPLQSDITERQPESSKIKNVCESEKKSLSSSIPSQDLETPVEQISTSRIDKTSRGHILADYEECMKLMERSPIKVETNLPRLSFTEPSTESDSDSVATIIKRSTTSKYELELKVPSSEECIQKSKSDTILINNQYEKKEIPSIRDKAMSILKRYRSRSESSATEIAQPSTSKSAFELKSR
ncbi:altered inheritance of mitochondria protein 21-like isoform X1 [Formica exsecta]|uniref:altered inheritance of mitochondria protein 21-like isoform X1 n=1 Tax=Formica exsecta TaxID=72781 RepID=UPI001142566A|nr:altered inheritance of mitochondria protein 21-like isoform X1 [Formica exsecta]